MMRHYDHYHSFLLYKYSFLWMAVGVLFLLMMSRKGNHDDVVAAQAFTTTAPVSSSSSSSRIITHMPKTIKQQCYYKNLFQPHHHHQQQQRLLLPNSQTTITSTSSTSTTAVGLFPKNLISSSSVISVGMSSRKVLLSTTAIMVAFLVVLFWKNATSTVMKRLLWPGYSKFDPNLADIPLPPGIKGCPLFGSTGQILVSNRKQGSGSFWTEASIALGNPRIFRFFFLGKRGFVISGGPTLKSIMSTEFASSSSSDNDDGIYVPQSSGNYMGPTMIWEPNGEKHAYLRKLVGQALTPQAVKHAIPNLQEASQKQIQRMITASGEKAGHRDNNNIITAEQICTDLTLEIAWKQILGLQLTTKQEELEFVNKVNQWVTGIVDPRIQINTSSWLSKSTPGYKAKLWLVKKIEEKIDSLIKNGGRPDESTLSGMVFATTTDDDDDDDDENNTNNSNNNNNKKLSREEIISNSLLLILAGSETSASTLTNCFLCLGKNYDKWKKLQEEQDSIITKYGGSSKEEESLNRVVSEKECPYLDAVIKETLRMKPIATGAPRKTKSTIIIDGYQIPKDSIINWNIQLTHNLDPTTYKEDMSHMDISSSTSTTTKGCGCDGGGFQPERWLDDSTRPTADFMPFGTGPHYCLGVHLAYTEMKIFLAMAARSIDFTLVGSAAQEKVEYKRLSIMPKERNGVPLIARPRKGKVLLS